MRKANNGESQYAFSLPPIHPASKTKKPKKKIQYFPVALRDDPTNVNSFESLHKMQMRVIQDPRQDNFTQSTKLRMIEDHMALRSYLGDLPWDGASALKDFDYQNFAQSLRQSRS